MSEQWANRITNYGSESPRDLLANPRNFRTHPRHQQDALAGVLRDVGIVQDVIVNQRTGFLLDGHLRVSLALRDGQTTIPVKYVDLSETEEALVLATLDPIAALAAVDAAKLDALLRDVSTGDAAVQSMLDALAVDAGIVPGLNTPGDGGDDFDTAPEDGPTRVQRGDLWQLGKHRLLCGDSTSAEDVARLMGGERADMVFTDPPYNHASEDGGVAAPVSKSHADLMASEWDKNFDFTSVIDSIEAMKAVNCTVYICASWHTAPDIWLWMSKHSSHHSYCVWSKPNPMPSLMKRHWTWASELICYATYGKHTFNFPASGHALNVWNITKISDGTHPTQKPIELVAHAITHSSKADHIIGDLFLGSGTTIIAAERTGRRCYGIEIEPKYCDVILRRHELETGQTAQKIG